MISGPSLVTFYTLSGCLNQGGLSAQELWGVLAWLLKRVTSTLETIHMLNDVDATIVRRLNIADTTHAEI